MNSRTTVNLILLALVVVLGAIVWFRPGLETKAEAVPLTRLKAAEISKIRIERASTQSTAFEKRDGKWWMVEPIHAPANDIRMEGVLRIAESGTARSYGVGEVDLVKTGLDQPEVKLSFNGEAPLAYGDLEPLNQQRYVRSGDSVFLLDDIGYYNIIGSYTTFVESSLLPADAVIEGFRLPGMSLTLDAKGWIADPVPDSFSADRVNALIDAWRHAQALEVSKAAEVKTEHSIEIQLAKRDKPLRFDIRSRLPEFILVRPDLQLEYHFPAEMAETLLRLPEERAEEDSHSH